MRLFRDFPTGFLFLAAFLFLTGPVSLHAEKTLWEKASMLFSFNYNWQPGSTHIHINYLEDDDTVKSREDIYIESWIEEEELEHDVVKAVKDGKDITIWRQGVAPRGAGTKQKSGANYGDNPLNPLFQDRVTYEDTGEVFYMEGKKTRRFSYRLSHSDGTTTTGSFWLETETGIPLKMTATLEPLPWFLKSFYFENYYHYEDDTTWYSKRMFAKGEAWFILFSKRFEATLYFDDYFRNFYMEMDKRYQEDMKTTPFQKDG
ncbi:MAG: hypothetical protein K9L68_09030 [Spirochaetales bacterium]|nr:hypothetical protein [Spirochaetales bacterium]MCF7938729.1 hypothetical protein [Spirochaetales bacterium]